ncbi:unnamed protein product [Bursaphelenchus xylophilus]|uniref:(pine wood nematode) hypothetical protein n=1 Tax=Bursaphelenchus xylophilus TaxID=6326 RepID=A0A1I7RXE0_BURXY|nr:unnamed protein product [Bursaphelenchus xylophilus]CAG9126314.1 unnamed protein product [Bursaphelenchus xylophilus]
MEGLTVSGKFAGKTVIVTGSSRGIGRAIALRFATKGAEVVIHGQNVEKLKETTQVLKELGVLEKNYLVIQGAIQEQETQDKVINETIKKFGKIDVLVNNVGVSHKGGLNPESAENMDFLYQVNLRSIYTLTNSAIPHLSKTKGNIINISSVGSQKAHDYFMPYSILKAAIDHFTRGAALKYAKDGIRVNTVSPGSVESDFVSRHGGDDEMTKAIAEKWANLFVPLKRAGKPDEVASLVLFVASDEASYITGTNMMVDGGAMAGIPTENWLKHSST